MPWIESHTALARHPKTLRLARALQVSVPTAIGHLHLLWWWALEYAQDGDLSSFDAEEIAIASLWDGDGDALLAALRKAGFVNEDGAIHDWYEYAGRLIERRRADAERKRAGRKADVQEVPSINSADVQETSGGHPADVHGMSNVPNPTIQNQPNHTTPNSTEPTKAPVALAPDAVFEPVSEPPITNGALMVPTKGKADKALSGRSPDHIWDALTDIFGEPELDNERSNLNGVCAQFRRAAEKKAVPPEQMAEWIALAHQHWPNAMGGVPETPNSFAKYFSVCLKGPQKNGRDAGTVRQVTQRVSQSALVPVQQSVADLRRRVDAH